MSEAQDIWIMTLVLFVVMSIALILLFNSAGASFVKATITLSLGALLPLATLSYVTYGSEWLMCGQVTIVAAEFNKLMFSVYLGLDLFVRQLTELRSMI